MGYYGKDWVQRKFGNSPAWNSARQSFQSRAWVAIFLTRFLITALAIPTNLIAGGSGYKFSRFMLYDVLGEFIWVFLYGGLGYLFGNQWELVNDFISNFGGVLLGVVILGAGIWFARSWQAKPYSENTS
jgi:membrane protein DedA with SNARE-associated domain